MLKLNPDFLLVFFILALALYRTARMLAVEKGPFAIFENFRGWATERFKSKIPGQRNWIEEGVSCPMCISFWLGFMTAWVLGPAGVVEYIVIALALSAMVVIVYRLVG